MTKIANRRRAGTTSRKSWSRLPARSVCWSDRPVTLPPGRAKLATRPVPTGSPAPATTIGMTDVACFAARTFTVPPVTMTSTFCRTNSATISVARSLRPSADRTSIATVRPSIQPSSRSRCTKAALRQLSTEALVGFKNPMVGSFSACCARAAERPHRRAADEQRDELAPVHCPMPPVLPTDRIAHLSYARRPLCHGISIRLMSVAGAVVRGMSRYGSRIAQAMRVGAPFFYILVRNPNERCRFDLLQTVIAAASSLQRREC